MKKQKLVIAIVVSIIFLMAIMQGIFAKELSCAEYPAIVSLWHFNEGTGSSAEDICGVNEGTIYGTPNWTTGKYGNALDFDGSTNYVDCGNDTSSTFGTGNFSVSVWIKATTHGVGRGIVDKYSWATDYEYDVYQKGENISFYTSDTSNYPEAKGQINITDGLWHHVVAVRSGEDMFLYIDGEHDTNVTGTGLGTIDNTDANLTIGILSVLYSNHFAGQIDEVALWNKALSQEEVLEIYEEEQQQEQNPLEQNVIYTTMRGAGAGLGSFIETIGEALPPLMFGLALVGIVVIIGFGIARIFNKQKFIVVIVVSIIFLMAIMQGILAITYPAINITYPTDAVFSDISEITRLEFTYNNISYNPEACWYSLDNGVTNTTINCAEKNITNLTAIEGKNTWYAWNNDSYGQFFEDSVIFIVDENACYQEFANISTECGGLNTGIYNWSDYGWTDISNLFDGDWDSYGATFDTNPCLFINYSIPDGVIYAEWRIRDGFHRGTTNQNKFEKRMVSINESLLDADILQLKTCSYIESLAYWFIFNGTDWENILSSDYTSDYPPIYEEAIIWGFAEPEQQQQSQLEQNIIYTTMRGAGAGLGSFIETIGEALPPLMFGLALVGIVVLIAWSLKGVLVKAGSP